MDCVCTAGDLYPQNKSKTPAYKRIYMKKIQWEYYLPFIKHLKGGKESVLNVYPILDKYYYFLNISLIGVNDKSVCYACFNDKTFFHTRHIFI